MTLTQKTRLAQKNRPAAIGRSVPGSASPVTTRPAGASCGSVLLSRGRRTLLILLAGTIALGACTWPSKRPPQPAAPPTPPPAVVLPTPTERATALLEEAETTAQATQQRMAIDAVLALPQPAIELLQRADHLFPLLPAAGMETLADRYRGAQLALLLNATDLAEQRLGSVPPDRDRSVYAAALGLQTELLSRREAWEQVLLVRVARDELLLSEPREQQRNQEHIWQIMASLPPGRIATLDAAVHRAAVHPAAVHLDGPATAEPARPAVGRTPLGPGASDRAPAELQRLRGWLQLFQSLRQAGTDPEAFTEATQDWRSEHPGHPASLFLPELRQATLTAPTEPTRIGVLLPLTGPYAELGQAVLEGILARHSANPTERLVLQVLDTGGLPETTERQYRSLLEQRVDRVIGPLTREEVEQVLSIGPALPTLLLNRPNTPLRAPFTVLSLTPEADAQAAALQALSAGWSRALVLLPEGVFGDRISTAFAEHFQQNGGRIAGEHRFSSGSAELNTQIGAALGIDTSNERIRRVARDLRLALDGDPQVRADIDLVFIAGPARDLRMVIPHLHYHRAARLPLLATAHIYEGRPQPGLDNDLSGVRFPDTPWLFSDLNPEPALWATLNADASEPSPARRLPRFAALGIDALAAAVHWEAIAQAPQQTLTGVAGTWALHPLGHYWSREPAWLVFRDGQPQPLHAREASASIEPLFDPLATSEEDFPEPAWHESEPALAPILWEGPEPDEGL